MATSTDRGPAATPHPLRAERAAALVARLLAPRFSYLARVLAVLTERSTDRVLTALNAEAGRTELAAALAMRWTGDAAWTRLAELGALDPEMLGDPARRFLGAAGEVLAAPESALEAVSLAAVGARMLQEAEGYARASARAAAAAGWRGEAGDLVVWRFLPDAAGACIERATMGSWRLPGALDVKDIEAATLRLQTLLRAERRGRDDAAAAALAADLAGAEAWGRAGGSPEADPFGPLVHLWALGFVPSDPPPDLGRPAAMLLALPTFGRGPARVE